VEHPNRNININELRVNVMPPAAETGATGERSSAESIASAIALRVQVLTGWYPVKYGDLAYRRINKILITVDGVPFQTFDLARQLRFVPHHEKSIHYSYGSSYSASGPGYRNADELDEWWRTICQVRAQNGLDTPDEKALVECDEEELMKYRKEIRR
jgi:hypothetical protein